MHISGILVRTAPAAVQTFVAKLAVFGELEVDRFDEASGQIVVVQESSTREEQEEGLRRIQALPGVASAELVCHFVEQDGSDAAAAAPSSESAR